MLAAVFVLCSVLLKPDPLFILKMRGNFSKQRILTCSYDTSFSSGNRTFSKNIFLLAISKKILNFITLILSLSDVTRKYKRSHEAVELIGR